MSIYRTILPSSLLQFADEDYYSSFSNSYHNVALRIGVVQSVYKVEDDKNIDKDTVQYDVLTFQQDKDKGVIPTLYKNCVTIDSFGGIGDFFEFVKTKPTTADGNMKTDDGSYVLLLCIDGTATRGVIIAALPHHGRKSTLLKAKDKHLEGEYNGLRMKINDDGELVITFKGKTDSKGKPKNAKSGGSQIKMEKDGSVELNDRDIDPELASGNNKDAKVEGAKPSDQYEKVRIDKTNQSINIISRKDQNQTTDANYNLTVKSSTTHKTKDWLVSAEGKANFTVKSTFDVKSDGALSVTASSISMKSDANVSVQANTVQVSATKIDLGNASLPAIVSTTLFVGIGNLGVPVISTAMGPFSSTVGISA